MEKIASNPVTSVAVMVFSALIRVSRIQESPQSVKSKETPTIFAKDSILENLKILDQGRRKHGNEIPWYCSGRSSGELSGPFCVKTPHFHVRCPQIVRNCSRERSLEHCHSHAFLVPN